MDVKDALDGCRGHVDVSSESPSKTKESFLRKLIRAHALHCYSCARCAARLASWSEIRKLIFDVHALQFAPVVLWDSQESFDRP